MTEETPAATDRFCLDCGYPLNQLDRARCPECGRLFDIADPRTVARSPRRVSRGQLIVAWVLLLFPVLMAAAVYVTWVAGRVRLGYWPRVAVDDPGVIGGWFEVFLAPTMFIFLIAPLVGGASIGTSAVCSGSIGERGGRSEVRGGCYLPA